MKSSTIRSGLAVGALSAIFATGLVAPASGVGEYVPTCELLPPRSVTDDAGNLFLGGDFIELGITPTGVFGTQTEALPDGFTERVLETEDKDTKIGMATDYDGFCANPEDNVNQVIDFFMPGGEEERWSVAFTVDGVPAYFSHNVSQDDDEPNASSEVLGALHNLTDESDGDLLKAVHTSVIGVEGEGFVPILSLTLTHQFERTQRFFTTNVEIENLSGQDLADVRFMRSFDPDNVRDLRRNLVDIDGFTTSFEIIEQSIDGDKIVEARPVQADLALLNETGNYLNQLSTASRIQTGVPISMRSSSPNAVVYFGGFENPNPYSVDMSDPETEEDDNPYDVFANPQPTGSTEEADIAMGIIFSAGNLAPAAVSNSFSFITSLGEFGPQDSRPEPAEGLRIADIDRKVVSGDNRSREIRGFDADTITKIEIGGIEVPFEALGPETVRADLRDLAPGIYDMIIYSTRGRMVWTDAYQVLPLQPTFWTVLNEDTNEVRLYAKNIVGQGKVQFFVDGEEIAFVNAVSSSDEKLINNEFGSYLVRTVEATSLVKNRYEIKLDGERVFRSTYVPDN